MPVTYVRNLGTVPLKALKMPLPNIIEDNDLLLYSIALQRVNKKSMGKMRIVALGSSFAAGPGIEPIVDPVAARSGRNYAHQLAEQLDADLTDLTVSGATLLDVLQNSQKTRSGDVLPPQLEGLPSDADIVTLTGGGNDLGYSLGMIYDSILAYTPSPVSWALQRYMQNPATGVTSEQLTDRFLAVIDAIHEKAPRARIYLVQYLSIFGQNSQPGPTVPLTAELIEHYRKQGELLGRSYEAAAKARPDFVELVPAAEWSVGHEAGTEEAWVDGMTLGMLWRGKPIPYHPNLAGHTVVARKLYDMVQSRKTGQA